VKNLETAIEVLKRGLYPLEIPFLGDSVIYWMYLVSAVFLVALLYILESAKSEKKTNFLQYIWPKEVYLHASSVTGYKYYFVYTLLKSFVVLPAIVSSEYLANGVRSALTQLTGATALFAVTEPQLWHHAAFTVFIALVVDFGIFYFHYLCHKMPLLWEFHKVHHSAEVLTPLTAYRAHPVELFFGGTFFATISGLAMGLWMYLFGSQMSLLLIQGVDFVTFAFYLAGSNLRHSHIWLAYPSWLSHILISPAQHQIHHSLDPKHYDKNFAYIFAFWDWLFGTLYVPRQYEKISVGLSDGESELYNSVSNILLQPFRAIGQGLRKTAGDNQ
jgi:sterol desaturase/sphingolipid hydroxylase (fatty acid hydroxylase superfamily)